MGSHGRKDQPTAASNALTASPALHFPRGFLWGVSTSAHQVEGGNDNNQWSHWEDGGRIKAGERCGQACDWWSNAEQDFDLAREIGVNSLRLSVEWSRIEPEEGKWNAQALQRYREMLEGLHQRGIQPMVCLHHFTHPWWFKHKGVFSAATPSNCLKVWNEYVREIGATNKALVTAAEIHNMRDAEYAVAKHLWARGSQSIWTMPNV